MRLASVLSFVFVVLISRDVKGESELVFSVEATRDTFLTHERVRVEFVVTNNGSTDVKYRPLIIDAHFVTFELFNTENTSVPLGISGAYYLSDLESAPCLGPHSSMTGSGTIEDKSQTRDELGGVFYLPADRYTAVFKWKYDPHGRALFMSSPYLIDTVTFVVAEPRGRAATALSHYLHALAYDDSKIDRLERLWNVWNDFSDTPYGEEALRIVCTTVNIVVVEPVFGMSRHQIARRFVLSYPDSREAFHIVARWYNERTQIPEYNGFLQDVLDSVPMSGAAKRVALQRAKK